uniref:Uncharacterized protein n=1 Tax=Tanacetum cinerariifolium TaxID=118510 RepID=A0A6L2M7V3_TANCI|nr:hypothetical protein [Tanacetum cinerariifolium]
MAEDGIKIDKFDGYDFGFWKMQIEDYLQALGAIRLSLAKNVAYEKTTYGLFKALSNIYEKPSASNKVFLIRQLVNMKMKEGASVADHVNKFNSILSRLMSVDIKFDDEVQALLLLSSLPESWSGTITAVTGSTGSTKLKFNSIRDLIIGEDIRRNTSEKYSNSLLSAEDKGRAIKQDRGQNFPDKEVNMAAGDYNDALVCCVENTIDDRIMDFGASFHATYCKEELEMFKLCFGNVHLADDKTLDIAGVGDVVLKTSFGTSWTLKDVRLRRLAVKVTKAIDDRGNAALWHQRLGYTSEKDMKILASKGSIPDLQKVVVGLPKKVWVYFLKNKSKVFNTFKKWKVAVKNEANLRVKCLKSDNGGEYSSKEFIKVWNSKRGMAREGSYGLDEMGYRFWYSKSYKVVRSRYVTFNEDSLYGAKAATNFSNLKKLNKKDQVSLNGSSNTSGGSENNGSFKDSGRSVEEDSKDRASSDEGGSKTPQVRRSTRKSKALHERRHYRASGCSGLKKSRMARKATKNLHLDQLDVKTTFLHGDLDEDIYMTQPEGFQSGRKEENLRAGYKRCVMDRCHYLKKVEIKKLKRQLSQEFKMKDLGFAKQILGMSIIRDRTKGTIRLSQEKYIGKVLEKLNMNDAETRCQPLGDHFMLRTLSLKKILGAKNPADMLTKVVKTEKLKLYAASTGL